MIPAPGRALSAVLFLSISTLLFACGDDAAESAPPKKGAGGKSGSAGIAGASGAGGRAGAGAAGKAGAPVGGAAGASGGAAGAGGGAGAGGAGSGGVAGASAGGNAGASGAATAGAGGQATAGAGGQGAAGVGGQATGGAGGTASGGTAGSAGQGAAGAAGQTAAGAGGQAAGGAAGQAAGGAAGQGTAGGSGSGPDPFTYAYNENGNFVRYQTVPNVFEKVSSTQRDKDRKLMPLDLHSWSIANFAVDKRMFTDFRLQDASSKVLYEIHDLEGAVHGELATTPRDKARGNNHQPDKSEFLVAEGDYTVVFTLLPGSKGRPQLIVWRQKPDNLFAILVGAAPSEDYGSTIDDKGYLVNFEETVTRTFRVTYVDEDNVLYKSNANGFEKP